MSKSAALSPPREDAPALPSMRRHLIAGIAMCAVLIVGCGGWAATANLAGAVLAPATIVVQTNLKKVQHPSGGVVGELHARNGDKVKAGDVVVRLDDTVTRSSLAVVTKSLDELEGRRARLEAERDDAAMITFSDDLMARAADGDGMRKIMLGEQRLFEARALSRSGQKAQLTERMAQLRQQIEGLEAQKSAKNEQTALIVSELKGVVSLYKQNLVQLTRLIALQRDAASLKGETGQLIASIAEAKGKIAETQLKIIQLDQDLRTEVLKELRESDGKIAELVERKIAAQDQLQRIDIRAPIDGTVHQLAVHTVGGVIGRGEILMLIVPEADALTIEAKVAPMDIDQVVIGQSALVRLSAFSQATTPELTGRVAVISADLTKDQQTAPGQMAVAYYTAQIELPPSELARLRGLKLVPGMPVEVHIQTRERKALSYFLKPLTDQIARAFKGD
ncbi:HlyD family type I secretion periplasmic adaptor subunit [Phyllobacterium salinisoli]|uniref:Membrane fusion protein (MFP) family protein n=1 Tax=Phyllobacterium salinisoli TaxID=1899321 RepID=A0A368JWX9_9HYPH|nr:HlyD family type I secretion periplasmic adaptor subunit [Phyllobacterium salinisoli]RCS21659.1 HlyD family type I secretion periplasmic adaptor subunit [Phyllobacterium salinisoli]